MKRILLIYRSLFSFIVLFICIIIFNSCAPTREIQREKEVAKNFYFAVKVVDLNGNPVDGANINYSTPKMSDVSESYNFILPANGVFLDSVKGFRSNFKENLISYEISKEGYFKKTGKLDLMRAGAEANYTRAKTKGTRSPKDEESNSEDRVQYYSDDPNSELEITEIKDKRILNTVISKVVTLYKPEDYLTEAFSSKSEFNSTKDKILKFSNEILLAALLKDTDLKLKSIEVNEFKGSKNLTFSFVNYMEYNSIRLNKYDVGKILFDEVVRKILTPLNDNFSDDSNINGFDLSVKTKYRSFLEDKDKGKDLVYRFILSKETVQKYKNKDITGQKVLDDSYILLDDERIELKLQ